MRMEVVLDGSKHVEIKKFDGDIQIGRRKALTDDFIRSMLSAIDEQELLNYLFEKEYLEVIQKYIDEKADVRYVGTVFENLIQKINNKKDSLENNPYYIDLLILLLDKVDIQKIDLMGMRNILGSALKNVDKMESDSVEFQSLLLTLLNKAEVNKELSTPALSKILGVAAKKVAMTENQEELKELFFSIVTKAQNDWLEKAISTAVPNRVLCNSFMPKDIVYYQKDLISETVVIKVQRERRKVRYHDVEYKQVGHPEMLFYFRIQNQRISKIKIACVKDKILKEDTRLYHYPYSNVFGDHRVCWSYGEYKIDSLDKLQHIPYVFLSTPNNGHVNPQTRMLFEKYQNAEFDDETLSPSNKTFAEFVAKD